MSGGDRLRANCRENNRSRSSSGVSRAGNADEQGRRPRSSADRAAGQATLDTVAKPVQNFLLFDYDVIRGTASNGQKSGGNLYPAPTLQVFPGETLIVHFENGLTGLTIRDYFIPQYTPKDQPVPLYPEQMTSSPINLHTHGAHISPRGNADNVMLHIPPGMSNTFTYDIPRNMPQGLYWYHCHLHGLTAAQVYTGLVGLLAVGRTDGNLPLVTEKSIPIRNMGLQYNFVFDRAGGLAQLNNVNWPQWASTIIPPKQGELANGTYRPLLTPVNFSQSKPGTKYFTVWYAGPLSIHNRRGSLQFIPSNLQHFVAADGKAESDVPAEPLLPDYQRDVQFTVNGQFQPVIVRGLRRSCLRARRWSISKASTKAGCALSPIASELRTRLCLSRARSLRSRQ